MKGAAPDIAIPDDTRSQDARCARCGDQRRYHYRHFSSMGGRCEVFVEPGGVNPDAIAAAEELAVEDLLAFALGQHRDKAEIVDLADWIHTAVAGKQVKSIEVDAAGDRLDGKAWARPPMLTLVVPPEIVTMVHGEPKDRDCLLLVHIKREVLDSWLAQQALAAGVQ